MTEIVMSKDVDLVKLYQALGVKGPRSLLTKLIVEIEADMPVRITETFNVENNSVQ